MKPHPDRLQSGATLTLIMSAAIVAVLLAIAFDVHLRGGNVPEIDRALVANLGLTNIDPHPPGAVRRKSPSHHPGVPAGFSPAYPWLPPLPGDWLEVGTNPPQRGEGRER
jgi:hypothetical protein